MIPPPEVFLTDSVRVRCDGSGDIPAALGHPRIWLEIDEKGYADCGYCDRRFVLRGSAAERSLREVSLGDINPEKDAFSVD